MFLLARDGDPERRSSFARRLYAISYVTAVMGFCLPVAVIPAFVFQAELAQIIDPYFFSNADISHFGILRSQYAFLLREYAVDPLDARGFRIFEMFIWIASTISVFRVVTGVCSRDALEKFRVVFDRLKSRGNSTLGIISVPMLGGLFMIFCSLNFKFDSASNEALILMRHSPRLFVCLMTFIFCTGTVFTSESLLFLVWLTFLRTRSST